MTVTEFLNRSGGEGAGVHADVLMVARRSHEILWQRYPPPQPELCLFFAQMARRWKLRVKRISLA